MLIIKRVKMSDKMLKFVNIGQQSPPKRAVSKRKDDFNEIYKEFIHKKASEQASKHLTASDSI